MFKKLTDKLDQAKDAALNKLDEQAQRLKDGALQIAKNAEESWHDFTADVPEKMKSYLPDIEEIILNKVLPQLSEKVLAQFDLQKKIEYIFKLAYTFLPGPVRLVVSEQDFVDFCHKQQEHLLQSPEVKKKLSI